MGWGLAEMDLGLVGVQLGQLGADRLGAARSAAGFPSRFVSCWHWLDDGGIH